MSFTHIHASVIHPAMVHPAVIHFESTNSEKEAFVILSP